MTTDELSPRPSALPYETSFTRCLPRRAAVVPISSGFPEQLSQVSIRYSGTARCEGEEGVSGEMPGNLLSASIEAAS
jgi:hypothetical protein